MQERVEAIIVLSWMESGKDVMYIKIREQKNENEIASGEYEQL